MDKSTGENRRHFFWWCETAGLVTNGAIAAAFSMSPQTVKNWRADLDRALKAWVWLAVEGYEACARIGRELPGLPAVTGLWFQRWMSRNRIESLAATAKLLGLTRQAVHNWFARNRFPNWLALACLGLECRRRTLKATRLGRVAGQRQA
ncbi:hypothetical protein ACVIGB_000847 [Bradyrhizobium sp. USDA 4341]